MWHPSKVVGPSGLKLDATRPITRYLTHKVWPSPPFHLTLQLTKIVVSTATIFFFIAKDFINKPSQTHNRDEENRVPTYDNQGLNQIRSSKLVKGQQRRWGPNLEAKRASQISTTSGRNRNSSSGNTTTKSRPRCKHSLVNN